ncbi:beta-ketoacyl-ACP synthase III [Clostridium tyrobutyricum]|uniref:Beta-ketoacyl-[acyl-carrier-protein] synthase III n=1 Tax=Clostridium tyrobutyricum DIVETGP TaxID=1408889 RepID=W6N904_CLOTY|nr:beta-ketoacyl-ACP synthase III [Clostridium tyrobutyricum]AND86244.1 3-oxoacyl-[acyl-carrier-protein] synthase [Clostridium tyrobutyricum]ANP70735.1 3-oxoacyl-ACP synthase [Clostridium tyrobutyricum]MBR9648148.1 ketoacyl-ACP synthase III [Clostridium tyrobutyricum]MBV4416941.1 ketoacyl-ACP synthase III [Clostridium tyrobutyricum]MBV4422709.1 ketoacyl-ACP synthase III [Clostridium tyrobutyricum]
MNKVKIAGTGSYVPDNIVTNDDLSRLVDTNDEWIKSRTGIITRRISQGEDTSQIATKAALKAMEKAKVLPGDIDFIIVATATPDNFIPSTACMIQNNIEAINATCFDVSAACSGFIYAMDIATQFIKTGRANKVLIIGAETLSKILDWKDRSTCILFGDGAAAAVLKSGDEDGIISTYTGSDGRLGDALTCRAVSVNNPYVDKEAEKFNPVVKMDGKEIFRFAVKIMQKTINKLLHDSGCSIDEIDCIIPHQANFRIIEAAAKRLNISTDKFYIDLDKYGNTSAASIGIAFDEAYRKGIFKHGDTVILVGFGGGLTYGGSLIKI